MASGDQYRQVSMVCGDRHHVAWIPSAKAAPGRLLSIPALTPPGPWRVEQVFGAATAAAIDHRRAAWRRFEDVLEGA